MAKAKMYPVIIDRSVTVELKGKPKITYPAGWRGEVNKATLKVIIDMEAGREVDDEGDAKADADTTDADIKAKHDAADVEIKAKHEAADAEIKAKHEAADAEVAAEKINAPTSKADSAKSGG